jgi:VanZ family protein
LKTKNRFFLPAISWVFISFVLLTLPGSAFPKENLFDKIWFDKWIHIAMFGIMTVLFCLGLSKREFFFKKQKKHFLLAGIFCLLYGIAMEFVQKCWIPNRSFDMGDIIADGVGCAAGVIYSYKRYIKK